MADKGRMGLWTLAILTVPMYFTVTKSSKLAWGLENEALIVRCPRRGGPLSPVEWYYSSTNESIPTQKRNWIFVSRDRLKFLPARVDDSGIYACVIRSHNLSDTGYVNVTIHRRQPGCNNPGYLMYKKVSGSTKNPKITCPTTGLYNWTAPIRWFKNCKALQGSRYRTHHSYLYIDNVTRDDEGDYTCEFMHTENGTNYNVTATRPFTIEAKKGFSGLPVIIAPQHNETIEVEIGKTENITCLACFGTGFQFLARVLWQINKRSVGDFGEARIQEEERQDQWNNQTCSTSVLKITNVAKKDLSLDYDCLALNLDGVRRSPVKLKSKQPIDRQSTYYIVAGCSMLLMLVNVLVMVLKVFWIDIALLWRDMVTPYKTQDDGKLYDAYVIYPRVFRDSSVERGSVEYFVHQTLPDVLENKYGYKLCIYGRDLLPGQDAATVVESSIQKSRRHMFVLAPHMMHSKEFAYEQEIALHSALIQSNSKVILIEMEPLGEPSKLQIEDLQDSLQHLVKMQGTVKWKEDPMANKQSQRSKFWKHVRYQMPMPRRLPETTSDVAPLSVKACLELKHF